MNKRNFKIWAKQGIYNLKKRPRYTVKYILFIIVLIAFCFTIVGCAKIDPANKPNMLICQDNVLYTVVPYTKWERVGVEPCENGIIEMQIDRLDIREDLKPEKES